MEKFPGNKNETESEQDAEKQQAYQRAAALREEIMNELERIKEKFGKEKGERVFEKLFNEIFRPAGIPREKLLECIVYHGLIGSSPRNHEGLKIDLPEKDSLLAFAQNKLKELKAM